MARVRPPPVPGPEKTGDALETEIDRLMEHSSELVAQSAVIQHRAEEASKRFANALETHQKLKRMRPRKKGGVDRGG